MTRIYAGHAAQLEDEALYRAAYRKISTERRKKTEGLRFQKDRLLSVGAELLLGQSLKRGGMDLKEMEYCYGAEGKPFLTGSHKVHFNLSHSGEIVVCAVSSQEIGCDIQKIMGTSLKVAERFFSTAEYEMILSQETEEARQEMFFRLWTLKESFIKSTGKGMRLPMDSFCMQMSGDRISVRQEFNDKTYYFQEFDAAVGYKCSVCGTDPGIGMKGEVPLEWINFSDILTEKEVES